MKVLLNRYDSVLVGARDGNTKHDFLIRFSGKVLSVKKVKKI